MALLVQKFGGTSVGSVERIQAVAQRIARCREEGHKAKPGDATAPAVAAQRVTQGQTL